MKPGARKALGTVRLVPAYRGPSSLTEGGKSVTSWQVQDPQEAVGTPRRGIRAAYRYGRPV